MNAIAVLGLAFALVALGHVIRLHRAIQELERRIDRLERQSWPMDSST